MRLTKSLGLPSWYWSLLFGIVLLRGLPFLWTFAMELPPDTMTLHLGYIPKDFNQYLMFIRQASEEGRLFVENRYTTDPQSGRFFLLLHALFGLFSALTALSPSFVLEFSRIPLVVLFGFVVWGLLSAFFVRPDERNWAAVLVLISGGIEAFVMPFIDPLPEPTALRVQDALWHLYGWNTFNTMFNPMWIAGSTLVLVMLQPILRPNESRFWRDALMLGSSFLTLYFIHPYSAISAAVIIASIVILRAVLESRPRRTDVQLLAVALPLPLALIAFFARWQSLDPVYREASRGVFGPQDLAVFWYPITFGVLLLFAIQGAFNWKQEQRPFGRELAAWLAGTVWLHTSPIINGYHFVSFLHLPLCILAAPAVNSAWTALKHLRLTSTQTGSNIASWFLRSGLVVCLFVNPFWTTLVSLQELHRFNLKPLSYQRVIESLSTKEAGAVFCGPDLGNLLPAYTSHRVWVGHWFLTPGFAKKSWQYDQIVNAGADPHVLREIVRVAQIRYIVIPVDRSFPIIESLGEQVINKQALDGLALLELNTIGARK